MPSKTSAGYEERYCAFIDFLGFADSVETGNWKPSTVISAFEKAKETTNDSDIQVTQFSDSLILSSPADDEWSFVSLIIATRFLILELTAHDVLLRGGITKGEMYHQDNYAFGPAFIRAYKLEQTAGTPRIILDRCVENSIIWPSSMDENEKNDFMQISIPKDYDGWRYVDYFSHNLAGEFDELDNGLEKHYEKLNSLVEKYANSLNPSIISKYGWLATKLADVGVE